MRALYGQKWSPKRQKRSGYLYRSKLKSKNNLYVFLGTGSVQPVIVEHVEFLNMKL